MSDFSVGRFPMRPSGALGHWHSHRLGRLYLEVVHTTAELADPNRCWYARVSFKTFAEGQPWVLLVEEHSASRDGVVRKLERALVELENEMRL